MIPESCRLFGQDHAVKQNDRDHERFILKRSCSRFEFSLCAVALDRADRFHNLAVEMPTRMCQDRHRDSETDEQQ